MVDQPPPGYDPTFGAPQQPPYPDAYGQSAPAQPPFAGPPPFPPTPGVRRPGAVSTLMALCLIGAVLAVAVALPSLLLYLEYVEYEMGGMVYSIMMLAQTVVYALVAVALLVSGLTAGAGRDSGRVFAAFALGGGVLVSVLLLVTTVYNFVGAGYEPYLAWKDYSILIGQGGLLVAGIAGTCVAMGRAASRWYAERAAGPRAAVPPSSTAFL